MNLLQTVLDWASQQDVDSGDCHNCNHPSSECSGSCQDCLNEIHFWYRKNYIRRTRYNCRNLAFEYAKRYTERYCENIIYACNAIDFSLYEEISILSLGCGISPDLMAFEDILGGDYFCYRGIDDNKRWKEFQDVIYDYSDKRNFEVDFMKQSVFKNSEVYDAFYNIIVMQFFISSVLGEGGRINDIRNLFDELIGEIMERWYNSKSTTPFLFVLNDTDHVRTGRKQFYDLLDVLVEYGYRGTV